MLLCARPVFREFSFTVRGVEDELGIVVQDDDGLVFRRHGGPEGDLAENKAGDAGNSTGGAQSDAWDANTAADAADSHDRQADVIACLRGLDMAGLQAYFGRLVELGPGTRVYYNNVSQELNGYFRPLFCLAGDELRVTLFNPHTLGLNSLRMSPAGVRMENLDEAGRPRGLSCELRLDAWEPQPGAWPPAPWLAWLHYFSPAPAALAASSLCYRDELGRQELASEGLRSYVYRVATSQATVTLAVAPGPRTGPPRLRRRVDALVRRLLLLRLRLLCYERAPEPLLERLFERVAGEPLSACAAALGCTCEADGAPAASEEAVFQLSALLGRRVFLGAE